MKKVIVSLLILLVVFSCGNMPKDDSSGKEKNEITAAEKDTVEKEVPNKESLAEYFTTDNSRIQVKDALADDKTGFCIYFSKVNGKARGLKMHIQYGDRDIYQFSIDRDRYTYKSNHSKGSRKNRTYWYDYDVEAKDMKFLRALIKSKSASIIFSDGTGISISEEVKKQIERTLDYYTLLEGKFPSVI